MAEEPGWFIDSHPCAKKLRMDGAPDVVARYSLLSADFETLP